MKKNGFTLIEVLGVIAVLALISTIILIAVNASIKKSRETIEEIQIENIKSAAGMWRTDNIELIPNEGYYTITLKTLKDEGYIKDTTNPDTNEKYNENIEIEISMKEILINE